MHVTVLGGGLQGCCIALALADRGAQVTLMDRNHALLTRAAVANEGKIHLGYMYAGDASLATARAMICGALAFAPFIERYVGLPPERIRKSEPAIYLVHRDSQRSLEEASEHLDKVHALAREASVGRETAYFGADLAPPRRFSRAELSSWFNPERALAAFSTPELAVEPVSLAAAVRERVAATPGIDVRLRRNVVAVSEEGGRLTVLSEGEDGSSRDASDHVVNALWEGRLAVDATLGIVPKRPWLHRLRYGVMLRAPPGARLPPTTTIIHGPFGEVVNHMGGGLNLMWYPACMRAVSADLAPPDWDTAPPEPLRSEIFAATFAALADIVPALAEIDPGAAADVSIKGGVIVAWGETDIDDPQSGLHRRSEIGVTTAGRYHSVDPGKLTMAPYFAEVCAERILPRR
jgi:glycine/D-amino acid oxidase-like deaminating enzyme